MTIRSQIWIKSLNSIHQWLRPLQFQVELAKTAASLKPVHQDQGLQAQAPQVVTRLAVVAVAPQAQALILNLRQRHLNLKQKPLSLSLSQLLKQELLSLKAHPS